MKTKILLTVLLGFSSFFLQAQIDKGKVQIGGDLSVTNVHYSENTAGNSYTDFSIHPAIGRFYSVNKMAGYF